MTDLQSSPDAREQAATGERRAFVFEVESLPDGRHLASIRLIGGGPPHAATCETDDRLIALAREFFERADEWSVYDVLTARATSNVVLALADAIRSLSAMEAAEARARAERESRER